MKILHTPSFIRVNRELYNGGKSLTGQQLINKIETRYIVLPNGEDIERFPELEARDLDELRENFDLLSSKMVLGITGDDGKIMESFVSQMNSLNKSSSQKKQG